LEGAVGLYLGSVMGDQELAVHEVDVSFHTAEAVIESIEERVGMLVIVVGMNIGERLRLSWQPAGQATQGNQTNRGARSVSHRFDGR